MYPKQTRCGQKVRKSPGVVKRFAGDFLLHTSAAAWRVGRTYLCRTLRQTARPNQHPDGKSSVSRYVHRPQCFTIIISNLLSMYLQKDLRGDTIRGLNPPQEQRSLINIECIDHLCENHMHAKINLPLVASKYGTNARIISTSQEGTTLLSRTLAENNFNLSISV